MKKRILVRKIHRSECHTAKGLVVVIDVIRAFTTAAFAFASGAEKIILVSTVEEAFRLKELNPEYLLMGEVDGYPIKGFRFGNSPVEVSKENLYGKTLVQRTSSGTQGVVGCAHADHILTSSFVVAKATLNRILEISPNQVTFVITGQTYGGSEDLALADYLEECLQSNSTNPVDVEPYLKRVWDSPSAQLSLRDIHHPRCSREDLETVTRLDVFPFAMEVSKQEGLLVMHKV